MRIMLSASYYLRKGDYTEADHLYELIRKEFNKSPHLENAYVLGAYVKLMEYQGPEYDPTPLREAKKLKETTLRLYPNRPDHERMLEETQEDRAGGSRPSVGRSQISERQGPAEGRGGLVQRGHQEISQY